MANQGMGKGAALPPGRRLAVFALWLMAGGGLAALLLAGCGRETPTAAEISRQAPTVAGGITPTPAAESSRQAPPLGQRTSPTPAAESSQQAPTPAVEVEPTPASLQRTEQELASYRGPMTFSLSQYDEYTINSATQPVPVPPENTPIPRALLQGLTLSAPPAARRTPAPPAVCPPPGNPTLDALKPAIEEIVAFLNGGGSPASAEKALNWDESISSGYAEWHGRARIVQADVTGDTVPDLLLFRYGQARYYAPYIGVTFLTCQAGRYESQEVVAMTAGGLSLRAPLAIEDMNGNGVPEVVLAYTDLTQLGSRSGQYFQILEWDGRRLAPLVNNALGAIQTAVGEAQVLDADNNGSLELAVVHHFAAAGLGDRPDRIDLYAWDGQHFVRAHTIDLPGSGPSHPLPPGWSRYTTYEGFLPDNNILSIAVGPDSSVWFGTSVTGVVRFDGENWTTFTAEEGVPRGRVAATIAATDGALWFGTWGDGAYRFDGQSWRQYTTADGLLDDRVHSLAVGPDGSLWFGTEGGISRFDGQTWTDYDEEGLTYSWVSSLAVAADGTAWAQVSVYGLWRFDGERWTQYSSGDTLAGYRKTAIIAAPDGAVWFATLGGVSRFDGQSWRHYTTTDGLANNEVRSLAVAPDGSLWAGHEGMMVSHFDGAKWTTYDVGGEGALDSMQAVAVGADGVVWFGTDGHGILRYEGDQP